MFDKFEPGVVDAGFFGEVFIPHVERGSHRQKSRTGSPSSNRGTLLDWWMIPCCAGVTPGLLHPRRLYVRMGLRNVS